MLVTLEGFSFGCIPTQTGQGSPFLEEVETQSGGFGTHLKENPLARDGQFFLKKLALEEFRIVAAFFHQLIMAPHFNDASSH